MWYYNNFSLDIEPYDVLIIKDLRDNILSADYALDFSGGTSHSCYWYDHEEDLKKFSLLYPDTLFMLTGEGEEKRIFGNCTLRMVRVKRLRLLFLTLLLTLVIWFKLN
jgi:hypothetical protein